MQASNIAQVHRDLIEGVLQLHREEPAKGGVMVVLPRGAKRDQFAAQVAHAIHADHAGPTHIVVASDGRSMLGAMQRAHAELFPGTTDDTNTYVTIEALSGSTSTSNCTAVVIVATHAPTFSHRKNTLHMLQMITFVVLVAEREDCADLKPEYRTLTAVDFL